jgi:hypothetical protein
MRPFFLLLCLFLVAGFITNTISTALDNWATPSRTPSATKNFADWVNLTIPTICDLPGHRIVSIGASQTFFGITPVAIDAELEELGMSSTTYNMAFPALDPTSVELLARHIYSNWCAEEKLDILVVGFAPHFFTRKYAENDSFGLYNQMFRAHLGPGFSDSIFLQKQSINDAIRTLAMQLLNVEPGVPRQLIMDLIKGDKPTACQQEFSVTRGGQSCYGFGTMEMTQKNMLNLSIAHRNIRVLQADLLELELDYDALDHVVRTIDIAKQIAKQVFLVLTPRNTEIVGTTPEGLARLEKGLSYISQRADVEVIDFYSEYSGYDIESFNDATHLNADGAKDFSAELATILHQKIILSESDN